MTHDEKWAHINRLLAAMPSSLADFYAAVREVWPRLWANLPQFNTPIDAAASVIQNLLTTVYVDGVAPTPEEFVVYFETRRKE